MEAVDDLLGDLERSRLLAQKELEAVRKELVRDLKAEAKGTAKSLQTAKIGSAKLLVRNGSNLTKINLSTERMRKKMSSFRLTYLDRSQVDNLKADGTLTEDPKKFIRHSRRLARHSREFLQRIKEEEPSLQEEVDETLAMLDDNDMDLLKLEVKSMTRLRETLIRGVNGKKERGQVLKEIDDWDINRQLFNLSVLEHQDAVVRKLFANASEKMGSATTEKLSEIPKRSHLFVGLAPQAAATMTPGSRTADISWRLFNVKELNDREKKAPGTQRSSSSWRDLGLGFSTKEWYIPVPPAILSGLAPLASARRVAQLEAATAFAEASEIVTPD